MTKKQITISVKKLSLKLEENELVDFNFNIETGTILTFFNVNLQAIDFQRLKPGKWLDDEIINFYGELIMKRSKDLLRIKTNYYPRLHFFSTFFYTSYLEGGFDKIKRWTKKVIIVNC